MAALMTDEIYEKFAAKSDVHGHACEVLENALEDADPDEMAYTWFSLFSESGSDPAPCTGPQLLDAVREVWAEMTSVQDENSVA